MRHFFKDALEPFCYLIYAISLFIALRESRLNNTKVLFAYYLAATLILSIACFTKQDFLNKFIYNLFFFMTICVLSYYFRSLLVSKTKRILIRYVLLVNLVLFIYYDVISRQTLEINTLVYAITFLSIVVYALFYFEHVIRNVNELNLLHQFDFWLVSGYLLYFFSSFFIILFYNNVEINQRSILWSLQNIILFLSSLLTLSGSLWIYFRKKYY